MTIQTKPNIQIPWADTGTKEAFSEAKLRQGWVSEIPKAENENWSQNRQDTALMHIFQAGISQWDSLTAYTANKSYVQASDGNIYRAITDNTGQDPVSSTAWRFLIDGSSKLVNESRTLSTSGGIQGGGNLSANRNISLAPSGVSPGNYGSSGSVSAISVDATGRVISAQNQAIDFSTPFSQSLKQPNGYQYLPNGLIFQWGTLLGPTQIVTLGTFTIPFPNACLNITASKGSDISATNEYAMGIQPQNNTGFRFLISSPNAGSQTFYWQAIGF